MKSGGEIALCLLDQVMCPYGVARGRTKQQARTGAEEKRKIFVQA